MDLFNFLTNFLTNILKYDVKVIKKSRSNYTNCQLAMADDKARWPNKKLSKISKDINWPYDFRNDARQAIDIRKSGLAYYRKGAWNEYCSYYFIHSITISNG